MFTALVAPSIVNSLHDIDSNSSLKSNNPFTNKAKGLET